VAFLLVGSLPLGSMLACQLGSGSPPTVEITFPSTSRQVVVGREVPIHSVSQDDRSITRVELWSGGQVVETTTAPGSGRTFVAVQHWTATEVGVFNVGVLAVDSEGQPSQPTIITIEAVAAASEITQPLPDEPAAPAQPTTAPSAPTTQPDGPPPPPEGPSPVPGEPVDLELWNLTLSNLTPGVGEEIVVGVTIINNGGAPAEDFHWGWDPGTGEEPIHSEAIAYLAPGDDVVSEMRYTYQQAGNYTGQAWADSWDAFDEPDETNNFAFEDVNVGDGGGAQGQPDLVITEFTYQSAVEQDEAVAFEVTLQNQGDVQSGNFTWGILPIVDSMLEYRESPGMISLGPGESWTAQYQGEAIRYMPGEWTAEAMVDLYDVVDEGDGEGNNTAQVTIIVAEMAAAATVEYHDYQDDAWATFGIQNSGTVPLESMRVRVRLVTTNEEIADVRANQPFLGGWSGRPPGDPSLAPGQGAVVAVNIGSQVAGAWCIADFTFYSEDDGGGLPTETITLRFTI